MRKIQTTLGLSVEAKQILDAHCKTYHYSQNQVIEKLILSNLQERIQLVIDDPNFQAFALVLREFRDSPSDFTDIEIYINDNDQHFKVAWISHFYGYRKELIERVNSLIPLILI